VFDFRGLTRWIEFVLDFGGSFRSSVLVGSPGDLHDGLISCLSCGVL
jgi:hypothetical protein